MEQQTTGPTVASSVTWERLETGLLGRKRAWIQDLLEAAATGLDRDWARMLTCSQFPKAHWPHLRTSNPDESPFAALRLRTDAAKRFKKVGNATAVIWQMLMVAQQRFRRLNAPELIQEVHDGARYVNGVRAQELPWEAAA